MYISSSSDCHCHAMKVTTMAESDEATCSSVSTSSTDFLIYSEWNGIPSELMMMTMMMMTGHLERLTQLAVSVYSIF